MFEAHRADAMRVITEDYEASDANEILQAVYSRKLRVLRAGTDGAETNQRSSILEQLGMEMVKDHQLRLRRELNDLADKIFRLEAFVDRENQTPPADGENMMTKGFEMSLMQSQLDAMRQYHSILSTRVMRDERYNAHRLAGAASEVESNMKQQAMREAQQSSSH